MMPKLPPPIADDDFGYPVWGEEQLLAYGRAVAEACASKCDFHVARLNAIDEPRAALAVGICATGIREAAKEIGK